MLVTLATNQALSAGATNTYTYSPNSLQKVYIRLEDTSGTDSYTPEITVQVGSRVYCNGVSSWALSGLTALQSGVLQASNNAFLCLDFGSIECTQNDNIYVTVYSSAAISAVDVSAEVDTPGLGTPLKITSYSDNTFTSNNCLFAMGTDSAKQVVDEDAYNIEVRNSLNSSAPSLISCNSWYKSLTKATATDIADYFSVVCINSAPMHTTFNYSSSAVTDQIITVEQVGLTRGQAQQGVNSARIQNTVVNNQGS